MRQGGLVPRVYVDLPRLTNTLFRLVFVRRMVRGRLPYGTMILHYYLVRYSNGIHIAS